MHQMDEGIVPPSNRTNDLGIHARSIRQTRYFVAPHLMSTIARNVTRTEFGRIRKSSGVRRRHP